jgi:hypothetical protein
MTMIGLALGLVVVVGVVISIWAFYNSFGDCGPPDRRASSAPETVTLSAEQPFVEQRVDVSINAAALPADLSADAAALEARWSLTSGGPVPGPPGPEPDPVSSALQVTFVREDTGMVEPRIGIPETTAEGQGEFNTPRVGLNCEPGLACQRSYRVILSLARPEPGASMLIGWSISGTVDYTGRHYDRCGPPEAAEVTVNAGPAVVGGASGLARAELAPASEMGTVVVRHVTVSRGATDASGADQRSSAWSRVNVHKAVAQGGEAWRTWLRVVGDDGTLLADGPLGEAYAANVDTSVDFPVLAGCERQASCERGYWLIFQSFASAPPFAGEGPTNLGQFAWSVEASATSAEGEPAGGLSLSVDDPSAGESPSVLDIGPISVTLDETEIPHAVDVAFTLDRPPVDGGLDPLAAAVAIIHAEGHGVGVGMRVEGDGAGPLRGSANGDGRWNLIAHPFDACETAGPCQATIRLVAEYAGPQEYGSQEEGAQVDWRISLLGAPPGMGFAIGDVVVGPPPASGPPVLTSVVAIAVLAVVALAVWVGFARTRRRAP